MATFQQMSPALQLNTIKALHTTVWLIFNFVLGYIIYAVYTNQIDYWVWAGVGLVVLEGLVLLIFRGSCPLTIVARKYSGSTKDNFDIFLPNWLAKNNKLIYTTIFLLALMVLAYRLLTNHR